MISASETITKCHPSQDPNDIDNPLANLTQPSATRCQRQEENKAKAALITKRKKGKTRNRYSRPKPRPRDRPQRDSSKHIKDDARRTTVHDTVVVAHLGADEQPGGARRPDARVRSRTAPTSPRDVAVVWRPDGRVQHLAAAHGRVVKGRARAGLDELVAVTALLEIVCVCVCVLSLSGEIEFGNPALGGNGGGGEFKDEGGEGRSWVFSLML